MTAFCISARGSHNMCDFVSLLMDAHRYDPDETTRYLHIAMQEIVALPLTLHYKLSIKRHISLDSLKLTGTLEMESRCNVKDD